MTIEELNNLHKEERRLWNIHQQRVDEANVARDTWYIAYRQWMEAEESMLLDRKVQEIIAREKELDLQGSY